MNRTLLLVVFLLAGLGTADDSDSADSLEGERDPLVGLWATEPDEHGYAHVRVVHEGGEYRGEIVWLSEPNFPESEGPEWVGKPKVDRLNPDPAERARPIVGLPLLWGFERKKEDLWTGGFIYDPATGKTYKCKITLGDDGTLGVRGFVGFSMLGRTTVWKPVEKAESSGTKSDSR